MERRRRSFVLQPFLCDECSAVPEPKGIVRVRLARPVTGPSSVVSVTAMVRGRPELSETSSNGVIYTLVESIVVERE